jgi:hypothetical protein
LFFNPTIPPEGAEKFDRKLPKYLNRAGKRLETLLEAKLRSAFLNLFADLLRLNL